jgi:hypothetical protein
MCHHCQTDRNAQIPRLIANADGDLGMTLGELLERSDIEGAEAADDVRDRTLADLLVMLLRNSGAINFQGPPGQSANVDGVPDDVDLGTGVLIGSDEAGTSAIQAGGPIRVNVGRAGAGAGTAPEDDGATGDAGVPDDVDLGSGVLTE